MAKAHTLVDNFNDNEVDSAKWLVNGSDGVHETNRRVEIRPGSLAGTFGYTSHAVYDLTDSEFRVELVRPLVGPRAATALEARIDGNNLVALWVGGGELNCGQFANGHYTRTQHLPYDAVAHRWLRLRESAGITYWEVSEDADRWNTVYQTPNPILLTAVKGRFSGELNKLAGNIAIFRNAAGVHWRSDYTESVRLGEKIASACSRR